MILTWKRGGRGRVLKFVTRLQIFLFLKISYPILRVRDLGVTKLLIFCGRYKCLTPKWFKITTIQFLEAAVSSSTSSQIHFDCHNEHTTNNPQLPPLPSPLMTKLKDFLLPVETYFFMWRKLWLNEYSFFVG